MGYKVVYTVPAAQPSLTGLRPSVITIHANGMCELQCHVFDATDAALKGANYEFTLSQAALDDIEQTVLQEAATAGVLPAGTVTPDP